MVNRPNQFAMKADYSSNSECTSEEFFVDELMSGSCDYIKGLAFVSPLVLKLELLHTGKQSELDAVWDSRGITSVESIIVTSTRSLKISDEQMLQLLAKSIVCLTVDYWVEYHDWSPADVSKFIEQWLSGSRTIERVIFERTMLVEDYIMSAVEMGQTLVEELGKLDQPPQRSAVWFQIDVSTEFDDQLFARLKNILVEEVNYSARCKRHFRFSSTVSVIRVTANDGRVLTIAICRTRDIFDDDVSSDSDDAYNEPRDAHLIYMFPST